MSTTTELNHLLESGQRFLAAENASLAIKVLEEARKLSPEHPQILFNLGTARLMNKEPEKALDSYRVLARLAWNHPPNLFDVARLLMAADAPLEAWEAVLRAEELAPPGLFEQLMSHWALNLYRIADRLTKWACYDQALQAYDYALRAKPSDFGMRHDLWVLQLRMGMVEDAAQTIRAATPTNKEQEHTRNRYLLLCDWITEALADVPRRAEGLRFSGTGDKPKLVYALAMWGKDYVPLCARHLRSLAAPGNISELAQYFDLAFVLVTTEREFQGLQGTGVLALFGDAFPVEPIFMPPELVVHDEHLMPSPVMYFLYSMGMHLGIRLAQAAGAAITPFVVDAVVADGGFGYVGQRAREGRGAICCTFPVCDRETFLPALDAAFPDPASPITMPPSQLMGMVAEHMHHIMSSALVSPSNTDFSPPPGVLFWRAGQDVVAHGFHVHPLYISAERLACCDIRFTSMDGHLVGRMFPSPNDWADIDIIENSDQFMAVSLTSKRQLAGSTGQPFTVEMGRAYLRDRSMINDYNKWTFRHGIIMKGIFGPDGPEEYDSGMIDAILADDPEIKNEA